MKPRNNHEPRPQRPNGFQRDGPNWVLVAGGALLSTLSIRLGYKLKQVLDGKQPGTSGDGLKGNGKYSERKKSASSHLHHNPYCFAQDVDGYYNCVPGSGGGVEMKQECVMVLEDKDLKGKGNVMILEHQDNNQKNGIVTPYS